MDLQKLVSHVWQFEAEAHKLLASHESSRSRVVVLSETYKQLGRLNIIQDDLMRQALRCVEHELFRAAHVMAWAAFIDHYEEKLAADGLDTVGKVRAKWPIDSLEDLRESVSEFQLIAVGRDVGLLTKNDVKALHGMLNKRNECAHPSEYYPGLNDTLGFISELFQRIAKLDGRDLKST
jgi:hypothetical protein